jgi:hypothetical protein
MTICINFVAIPSFFITRPKYFLNNLIIGFCKIKFKENYILFKTFDPVLFFMCQEHIFKYTPQRKKGNLITINHVITNWL